MRKVLEYDKYKVTLKEYLPPRIKEARNKWVHGIYIKYSKL